MHGFPLNPRLRLLHVLRVLVHAIALGLGALLMNHVERCVCPRGPLLLDHIVVKTLFLTELF